MSLLRRERPRARRRLPSVLNVIFPKSAQPDLAQLVEFRVEPWALARAAQEALQFHVDETPFYDARLAWEWERALAAADEMLLPIEVRVEGGAQGGGCAL